MLIYSDIAHLNTDYKGGGGRQVFSTVVSMILTDAHGRELQGQVVHQTCEGKAVNQEMAIVHEVAIEGHI